MGSLSAGNHAANTCAGWAVQADVPFLDTEYPVLVPTCSKDGNGWVLVSRRQTMQQSTHRPQLSAETV